MIGDANLDFSPDALPAKILPNDHSRQSNAWQLVSELQSSGVVFQSVLDLGCGIGSSNEFFKRLSASSCWIGIDLKTSPEVSRRQQPVDNICAYDGIALPFPASCFDLIYSRQVLEHVLDPVRLLQEVGRVVKPGGYFVGSVSQLEPYHSYSTWNWTPYGLYRCLSAGGLNLVYVRPGIDGLTLIIRAQGLRNRFMDRFFDDESPLNLLLALIGRILRKRHLAINAYKLRFAGHICFVAQRNGAG